MVQLMGWLSSTLLQFVEGLPLIILTTNIVKCERNHLVFIKHPWHNMRFNSKIIFSTDSDASLELIGVPTSLGVLYNFPRGTFCGLKRGTENTISSTSTLSVSEEHFIINHNRNCSMRSEWSELTFLKYRITKGKRCANMQLLSFAMFKIPGFINSYQHCTASTAYVIFTINLLRMIFNKIAYNAQGIISATAVSAFAIFLKNIRMKNCIRERKRRIVQNLGIAVIME
ncbi:hypothetical protein T4B_583 [Trichinella pseudospiralis]|uniref:Uncharacterized protein n=1 Tax=Trichinella pseudospiralis TaxID=6337 RepID=A0A0V1J0A4_TRIPS|nr:hypothetical protein T4B_583 [Trichinella pseudospiralis]